MAQPTTESVTVTGTKSRQAIHDFVQAFTVPTRVTGKLARWEDGACPTAKGIPAAFAGFIVQRVRTVAAAVGAPVGGASCRPNIEVVFTSQPQAFMDDVRKKAPDVLGYYDNAEERLKAATVTHPIQSWYVTQTVDVRGKVEVDSSHSGGLQITVSPRLPPIFIPHAHQANVSGSRVGDGLHSSFYHVLIVADPSKLGAYEIGPLADYIAMLSLAQLDSLDICPGLPSIISLLASGCAERTDALSANDTAYLKGLYKAASDLTLSYQQDAMAFEMEKIVQGK